MTAFTVILPHLRNPGNDAALRICLDMLLANTVNDFHLSMDAVHGGNLYATINRLVKHAPTDCCLYLASDTFLAPNWDVPMLEAYDEQTFVTGVLVEPGAIGMHHLNLHKDFGRKPETFRRAEFEAWAGSSEAHFPDGEGWYCPFLFSRTGFLAYGGYESGLMPDHHGFTGADEALFERWKAAGNRVVRARSYAFHLQRYSQIDEQEHEKRGMQS